MTAEHSYQFTSAIPPAKPVAVDTPEVRTAARPRAQVYWFHPDHLGTGTLITDLEGRPHQFFLNLPYGETFIEQGGYRYDNPYKFNGKELDPETGLYYYGARYYDPKISLWLSVDPLAEKYPSVSPYTYTYGNPVRFVDPTGMEGEESDWKPIVLENGNVGYVAEKGDNAETFASQYGLDNETAKEIVPENVQEGDIISGEKVKEVTGSEVLKLDLTSKQATDQRVFDHLIFSIHHSQTPSGEKLNNDPNNVYFSNYFHLNKTADLYKSGMANLNLYGIEIPVYYDVLFQTIGKTPFETVSFYMSNTPQQIKAFPPYEPYKNTSLFYSSHFIFYYGFGRAYNGKYVYPDHPTFYFPYQYYHFKNLIKDYLTKNK